MPQFVRGISRVVRDLIRRNKITTLKVPGLTIDLPENIGSFFIAPTRTGFDNNDKSTPFYSEDAGFLTSAYYGEQGDGAGTLYRQIVGFATSRLHSPFSNVLAAADGELKVVVDVAPYRVPAPLAAHGDASVLLHRQLGRIRKLSDGSEENNCSLRIVQIDNNIIRCQRAYYFDQLATNIVMDWDSGHIGRGLTIRNSVEKPQDGLLPAFADSQLANTLGVCAMFYSVNLDPIVRIRKPNLGSIPRGGLHCTVSGVYNFQDKPGRAFHLDVLGRGMVYEIEKETGLSEDQFLFIPVALARELPRGGKPQLFFIAISLVEDERFRMLASNAEEADEYVRFANREEGLTKSDDGNYSYFSKYDSSVFTYEGLACIQFCNDFIDINREEIMHLIKTIR